MEGRPDEVRGTAFTPLEAFVMELFRLISPNGGSISALEETKTPPYTRHGYIATPHTSTPSRESNARRGRVSEPLPVWNRGAPPK
jgi:hypothetical protein